MCMWVYVFMYGSTHVKISLPFSPSLSRITGNGGGTPMSSVTFRLLHDFPADKRPTQVIRHRYYAGK